MGFKIYRSFVPEAPPAPTVTYGPLPPLSFPQKQVPKLTFELQTPNLSFPDLPTIGNAYLLPEISPKFLSLDNSKQTARRLGFASEPQQITETIFRFSHPQSPAVLDMNIVTGTFSISYDLSSDQELLTLRPDSNEQALQEVKFLLSSANLLPEDLESGKSTFDYLKTQVPQLVPAISLSEANFIRVNLFRANLDELPILPPHPDRANVWFLISGASSRERKIIAGEYYYQPINKDQFSTYPLKTPKDAWDEFLSGKGFIAKVGDNKEGDKIVVRKINLAYYNSPSPQAFLQPIFVFEGDNGFVGYLPAVSNDYIAGQK